MARIIRSHGPCRLRAERGGSPYESLVSAVVHQQLNGKAAASILARLMALANGRRVPSPSELADLSDAQLRAVGLSAAKTAAIRDLAAKSLDGTLPSARAISRLGDQEIIDRCIAVRGVGPWTVQMLLIFRLGRPDVLPIDDYGVRNGYRLAVHQEELPTPRQLAGIGERWKPWRSVAAWYLWRVADGANRVKNHATTAER